MVPLIPTTTVCPECDGSGEVRHPMYGNVNCPEPTIPCFECGGTGEIQYRFVTGSVDEGEKNG